MVRGRLSKQDDIRHVLKTDAVMKISPPNISRTDLVYQIIDKEFTSVSQAFLISQGKLFVVYHVFVATSLVSQLLLQNIFIICIIGI